MKDFFQYKYEYITNLNKKKKNSHHQFFKIKEKKNENFCI